jgi:hypothetical protein
MNKKEQEDSLKRLLVRLNCMLYDLDDAEQKGFYAQKIKNLGNSLKNEIESKYRDIFKGMIGVGLEYYSEMSLTVIGFIEEYEILYQLPKDIRESFLKERERMVSRYIEYTKTPKIQDPLIEYMRIKLEDKGKERSEEEVLRIQSVFDNFLTINKI